MKNRFTSSLIKTILAGVFVTGFFMVLVSLQSFESLASLLNRLASDGELESFTLFLYKAFRVPFALIGVALMALTGFLLFQWKKTETWLHRFPTQSKRFFAHFWGDTVAFGKDAKAAVVSQGWLNNSILAGAMFVAIVLRLKNLDIQLIHDEAYMYNAFISRPFWHTVSNYHLPNNHVFLSVIIKIVTGLFGNHVWTLRLPTIIAGVLMVPASYYFAKRFYSVETAVMSSILVAVFPTLVKFSVFARGYIIVALITLLLFTLGDYVRVAKNRFAWFLIAFLSALGFFTIPIMLFPFGALYIWLIVSYLLKDTGSYDTRFGFLKYWVGSGIFAAALTLILYTPIIIYSFDRFFGNGIIAPLDWGIFPITIWTRLRNTWTEWTEFVPLWISLMGILGMLVSLVFHKKFSKPKFPLQLATLIWIAILLIARRPDMHPRFWLFLVAPILVWSAAGIIELLKRIPLKFGKGWNPAQVFVTLLFAFVFAQGLLAIPSLPAQLEKKDDLENTTIYLKDYLQQGDLVMASVNHLPAMRYYFNLYEIPRGYIRESGLFQRAFVIVDKQNGETLESVSPKIGFDLPAVDIDTAKILVEFEYLTVYECYPAQ